MRAVYQHQVLTTGRQPTLRQVADHGSPSPAWAAMVEAAKEGRFARRVFARDRDLVALQSAFARLDEHEQSLSRSPQQSPTAAEARAYLEDLPRLWRETSAEGRRAMAQAIFDQIEVLGATDFTITLTPEAEAHGFADAFGPEFTCSIGGYGRGERACPDRSSGWPRS